MISKPMNLLFVVNKDLVLDMSENEIANFSNLDPFLDGFSLIVKEAVFDFIFSI